MKATPESEAAAPLAILNHPPTRLPGPEYLHDLVRLSGNTQNAAIEYLSTDGDRVSISYEDLHCLSDSLAQRLIVLRQQQQSDTDQFVVPVLAPQHPNLYVAILAILKAGGAFCPLNLDAPLERVKFILKDVAATIILTTSDYISAIPADDSLAVLLLDEEPCQGVSIQSRPRRPKTTDLAYVMYTSGSTGTPKGVGVSHEAATQSLLAHDRHIPQFSRFLQFAAPTFDVSVFEIFFPLFRGSTLIACDRARMLDDLPSLIRTMHIDACELTPSVAGSLLRKRENAPCLKLLLTIGEMLTKPVVDEFGGDDAQPSMLWAMYGPTEAAIHCTLQPALAKDSSVGNIGIPLDTVSAFILDIPEDTNADKTRRLLAVGEVGELAVGGYQLANGYINRPETTSSAFIDSPYGPLYRTCDKARILPDGTIECLGRIGGGQVKLRGQRIELGEIEQVALRTSGCHGAMAAVIGGILVLFCAVDVLNNMDIEIRNTCEAWLPSFMVPGDIVTFTEFPILPSGKVNRRQLISDYALRQEQPHHTTEFKDLTEQTLCRLAGNVLGCDIRPSTNLPAAGLDSLVAIKFTSALRQAGFELSAVDVLRSRSISQLHQLIAHVRENTADQPATTANGDTLSKDIDIESIPILHTSLHDVEEVLPCTFLQSAMLAETASNPQAYCNWLELSVTGKHDITEICSWIAETARRNTILRTGFVLHDGDFTQILWKDPSTIPILTVDHLTRDFNIITEEDFLHPLRVQICAEEDELRVLLQIHHSLYDGWTSDLLLSDMNALSKGKQLESRPQFRAVADYCQSKAFTEQCDLARRFWAEGLASFQSNPFPNLLDVPPHQSQIESRIVSVAFKPRSARRTLQEIECSPQVLFQAALAWIWSSLVGDEDIITGFVTSGRTIPVAGIEQVMGPCIATLPLRTNLSQTRTVKDLLASIQAWNRSALSHTSLPLGEIKKAAGIAPGQSLYDVLFVYQESLYSPPTDADCIREVAHLDYLETKLLVEVEPKQDYYECRLTYHTDAFSDAHIALLIQEIQCVARHMLENIDSELVSTTTAFPEQILSTYNLEPQSFTGTPDLVLTVENVVSCTPDKTALCFASRIAGDSADAEYVSYREFNSMANKIARHIRSSDCSTGDVVSIVMEKSVLLYAGILGILKAGCSYLPLLPSTPIARMEVIHSQANVSLCLTDNSASAALSQLLGHQFHITNLDQVDLQRMDDTNLNIPADPARIAVIVYTSGSTGVPKGVCVTQLNVASNIDVLSKIYPVKENSRLLQSCSQAFDVSVFEMFFTWTQGMTLCSATNDTLFEDIERSIRTLKVTHLSMTPTVASLIDPKKVPMVDFLVTSGEPMTEKVARSWWRQLYQGYGPSETTNICTVKKMGPNDVIQHLGYSFGNTSTVVLFLNGSEAVPRGCLGELCFGGDQVAQGYLNMPELTAAKFIDHPKFGRLYRSGDIGRMLPDGSLVITGRVDDQIKLRGQRIELSEINAIIRQSNIVSDCLTLLVNRENPSAMQLASFYVPQDSADIAISKVMPLDDRLKDITASIFRLLASKLPSYMVPSYLVPVSKLPLTASGKLDRAWFIETFHKLGQSYLEMTASNIQTDQDDGEWNETERKVADIVSSVLSTGGLSINRWAPLVSFGLDSISAISLSRRLHKQFGRRIPVSLILQNSCVAHLAHAVDDLGLEQDRDSISLEIFSGEWIDTLKSKCQSQGKVVENILPCTPLQEAMLAASANGKSYLNNMLFRLHADPAAVKGYWATMCERQSILRTCFAATEMPHHAFAQVILHGWQPKWLHFDEAQGDLDECVSQHLARHTDAVDSWEPPVSFAIIRQGEQLYLSFVCHHALYDGNAIELLLHEVEQLADGIALETPPAIEPFLRAMLADSPTSNDFWNEQLLNFGPVELPTSRSPATEKSSTTHDIYSAHINIKLSDISERTKNVGCSLLSVCQAAWTLVLTTILEVDDVCFGNVVSCRSVDVEGIEKLVAPCFNTVPIRASLSNIRRNIDLIKALSALSPQVIQHQFTSLRRIQSLAFPGEVKRLFDTLLILQQPARSLDHRIWSLERDDGEMDIPLVCEFRPDTQHDVLLVQLHYECSRISKPFIDLISDLLQHCMSACLRYPSSQIPTRSSLPPSIAARLLELDLQRNSPVVTEIVTGQNGEDWSPVESRIRAVLAKLSSLPEQNIRRTTTIYQLGLDSINAVQIASLLRKQGMAISASDVIVQKTCANLAKKAVKQEDAPSQAYQYDFSGYRRRAESQLGQHGISKELVDTVLPCTSLQAGMIVQFVQSKGHDYFNYIDFQLDEDIELHTLTNAWAKISDSHAMLRTGFIPVDDAEFPYAMVQYSTSAIRETVSLVNSKTAPRWSIDKWRLDMADEVLNNLQIPPWRVVCVDHDGGPMMHLAAHHALYDAQSLQRMLEDLAQTLRGEPLGPDPAIEEVVKDIITQGSHAERQEAFWKAQSDQVVINHFPTLTPLRVDSKRMIVESTVSNQKFTEIEQSLGNSGFTVQAGLQAAWTRILSSYLGESSVTFGIVLSGRNSEATQDAVFPCISTVPVISVNKSSNRELLQAMLAYSSHVYQNQHIPLNKIQRWLGYPEGRVFDTLLVYQKLARSSDTSLPWKVVNDQGTVDYPVSIEVEPSANDTLVYRMTSSSDVVPVEHAKLLLEQFDAVFCDLALRPDGYEDDLFSRASSLFSCTPAEEPQVYCKEDFLHQLVESQALKDPNKTALEFVSGFQGARPISKTWSYRSLDENGNRVARMLQRYVKTGATVAVLFDKCPEAFFSILGVLKAGCAFVALDPGSPPSRKQFILEDSRASVLLTSSDLEKSLGFSTDVPHIVIDEASLLKQDGNPVILEPKITPQHTCYCLYTSGTTGTPKGCEITHENAVQAMLAFQRLFVGHWDETSKWLQFASFHFDVAVLEQYWSWSVGIILTAAPRDLILEDLAGTISRLEITHIDLTPSLARLIHPDEVPSLTRGVFITGGEQLKQEILDAWGSKSVIYNAYGPTEATIGVTTYSRVPQNGRPSNIGKQFVNVGTYVLKPGTETPVLRGGMGELCVSGKLVGKGYLGRDDLTAERFPTLKQFNERVYRTGDLVRILHDGCFDFLGRADDQVKLRGQRLELGEINHIIRSGVSAVTDVATLVVRNEKQRKDVLVTFVGTGKHSSLVEDIQVLDSPEAADLAQRVQSACRDRLPPYMVPTYVLVLPFIPLSSNNKAETRKLKKLFVDMDHAQLMSLMKPASEPTIGLNEVGREVLRVLSAIATFPTQEVDSSTTIFDFGIDSISAMRFSTALKRAGFPQASPSLILTHPRLGDLASQLSQKRAPAGKNHTLAARQLVQACHHKYRALVEKELDLDAADIEYIAPCSPLQEGMISRSNMPLAAGAYFNTFQYKLSSQVSSLQLRKAWTKLVESCSVLRTRFLRTTDGYVQVATKVTTIPWTEFCLASESDLEALVKEKQQFWIERNTVHVKQPLDLMTISIGEETKYLVVNISHGIYDAMSLDIMLDRLLGYYLEVPVSSSAPSYLEALVHGPLRSFNESKGFWVEHLKSALHQKCPVLCKQPSSESLTYDRLVPVGDLESLRTALGVTHQAILQAVWVSVYQQFLENVTIGVVISGRSIDLEGADAVIGPLFNTIAFHPSLAPGETWASLIKQCHNYNVSIIPFQHIALRDVQKWCSGGKPLFDTLFSFQRAADKPAHDQLWTLLESPPNPDYALAFEAMLTSDGHLRLQLVTKAGIADMHTLSMLLDQVEVALQSVLTPELPIPLTSHHGSQVTQNGAESLEQTTQKLDSFEWTETALTIRDEIASLADIPADSLTATTSLLELGLDSIDLIKLSSRLRSRGIGITSGQLMRDGAISAMVQHLEQGDSNTAHASNDTRSIHSTSEAIKEYLLCAGFDIHEAEDVLPVTPLQDSMIAEMVQSDFHRYFNHDVLALDPAIDTYRLLQAWEQVVVSSPILRTTFLRIDSPKFDAAYCQVISKSLPLVLQGATVTGENEFPQVMESARQRACEEAGRANLLQLTLVNVNTRRYLVLSIAHALYDGWSLGLLHQDVQTAYYESYVPRLPYKEYLTQIITASTSEAKQFWSGFLAGAHATFIPQGKVMNVDGEEEMYRIDTASSIPLAAIRDFCRRYAVSIQVLGQACWAAILGSHTKCLDVTFGVVLSGRDTVEAEELLFPTMNTVAVRSIIHGGIVSWLRYMQENMTNISSFQHYPLRDALKLAGTQRGPLFNSLFIQQRAQEPIFDKKVPWMASVGGDSAVEYPICVEVEISDEQLMWRAACNSGYMSRKDTVKLIHHLDSVLGYLVNSPAADVISFEGGNVSICGLPSFELSDSPSDVTDFAVTNEVEDANTWSETENLIRSAVSEVSGVPLSSISKKHTIYHLGLDSISTIKVSSLLRKRGVALSVRQILGAASIQEMIVITTAKTAADGVGTHAVSRNGTTTDDGAAQDSIDNITACLRSVDAAAVLIDAGVSEELVEEVLPATAMQVHMLSVWQNTSGVVFFPEFTYSLQGGVDVDDIRSAWLALVEHQPILRTSFLATGLRHVPFLQVIQRYRPELSNIMVRQGAVESEIKGTVSEPLVSLHANYVGKDHWRLKLKIHHALYDGISLPALTESFRQLCQEKWLSSQVSEKTQLSRKTFWTEYLKGVKTPPFQARTASPSSAKTRTSLFEHAAVKDTAKLQTICAAFGVSLQALFFAAYAKFLAPGVVGRDDIVCGMYLANRTSIDGLDRLPYPTLSLVPLRVRQPASRDVVAVAKSIQADLYEISSPANASVGLWEIFDWTGLKIDSFVNFLSLPDSHSTDGTDGIVLREASDNDIAVQSQTRPGLSPEDQRLLTSNSVRDAYPDAVDIEVSVTGSLMNIGVFGPTEMVDTAGAAEIVSGIVRALTTVHDVLGK
ncbi:non-ribosomal peptide synthetase [Coniochaeta ligniaria NRRL 30616]|uniref:Non-ribosomal peptide synthetase n=1 Tax=Coniochaeta ligniaria NRRL 30616 TaxID=1408157 RepID=A0A1J7IDB4_9PEZI|nr:non-ribosomal peptide synthetase [Coniochaeta ligniaria NRRL 30616]